MSLGWRFDSLVQNLQLLSPAGARGLHQPANMTCGPFVLVDEQESFVMCVLYAPAIWMRSGPPGLRWSMGASGVLEFHDQASYLSQDELKLCRFYRYEFNLENMNLLAGFFTAPRGCDGASCPMESYFQHVRCWREGLVPAVIIFAGILRQQGLTLAWQISQSFCRRSPEQCSARSCHEAVSCGHKLTET